MEEGDGARVLFSQPWPFELQAILSRKFSLLRWALWQATGSFWLTRILFLRALGLVYFTAFFVSFRQALLCVYFSI